MNINKPRFIFYALLIYFLSACHGGGEFKKESSTDLKQTQAATEETSPEASAKAEEKSVADTTYGVARHNLDSQKNRQFVRTGEMRFQVKNVQKTTQNIEDLTIRYQGFIIQSNLRSQLKNTITTQLNVDSLLETKYFVVENELILRIPATKTDSLLRDLNSLIGFLDYRLLQASDVSLQVLAKDLRAQRYAQYEKRYTYAIDNKSQKLGETTAAEDNLLNRQNEADDHKIQNLSLADQVSYATLKIFIYQRESLQSEVIANYQKIEDYRPSLGWRLGEAFKNSWLVVEEIIVFLAHLWFVLLILGVGLLVYQRWFKNTPNHRS
ncbi:MAG: DUF4349 domain-containing protein [Microscillaceae bacterium]|nr:DUF4349 domain-containing protein [Microscillaceae bacterium]